MHLGDVLTAYAPTGGRDWPTATADILDDPYECRIVLDLADELVAHGRFDEPVGLAPAEADEDGDWPAEVSDGIHRICAHVVTAHTDVLVTDEDEAWPDIGWHELEWKLPEALPDEMFDRLFPASSFRLTPRCWVRCETVGGGPEKLRAMIAGATEPLGSAVLTEITRRYEIAGATLTNGTCRWVTPADLDA